jgi:isopenicillin N synthase-like dioxygenase
MMIQFFSLTYISIFLRFFIAIARGCASDIPIIDIKPLLQVFGHEVINLNEFELNISNQSVVGKTIHAIIEACSSSGFFYIKDHGVSADLIANLTIFSRNFFALSQEEKDQYAMEYGGRAWRGYFRLGDEVTSGIPDQKEGFYFGTELPPNASSLPLHGPNLWPQGLIGKEWKSNVMSYMHEMKLIGRALMISIFVGLGVQDVSQRIDQFNQPTELFRIFKYPPHNDAKFPQTSMGVGEHTDYGYLTILWQEEVDFGGLQIRSLNNSWIDAPTIPGTFIVNLGDALEHATGGYARATPHRVLQRLNSKQDRLSFPYFFDPPFGYKMESLLPFLSADVTSRVAELQRSRMNVINRWDKSDPVLYNGTYGDYLINKVSKAFPSLASQFEVTTNLKIAEEL